MAATITGAVLALSAAIAGGAPAPFPPIPPEALAADTIHLSCSGSAPERGDLLRRAVEGARDGATIALGACTYQVAHAFRDAYNTGILIGDVSDLVIRGAGRGATTVHFERSVYLGFEVRSNTVGLTIADMTIAGSIVRPLCEESPDLAPACHGDGASLRPNTHGIASSGSTTGVSGVTLRNLEVRDLAVGISATGSCEPGAYVDVEISGNHVHDIYGATLGGQGYGIHAECAQDLAIRGNTIARVSRHSIYQARTPIPNDRPVVIVGNTILDHGHHEKIAITLTALTVARSDNVAILDNTLIGGHAYGISAEADGEADCTRCLLIGNQFVNGGAIADIWISARSPVRTWANTRGPGEGANLADLGGRELRVDGPGDFWGGTTAISALYDSTAGVDHLYVVRNSRLHILRPVYGTSPESWPFEVLD